MGSDAPRRQLGLLFVVSVIDILGFGLLIPLVPYMGVRFGASAITITAILGSYSACQFLAAPLWGRLSDRYGRRAILVSSLAGACISYALLALARGTGSLLLSRMLAGCMAGNIAAAFAYASDISKPSERTAALGVVGAAIGVGFTLGQPIGGLLAGNDARTVNFVAPAVVSMAMALLAILLVAFALPESHRERTAGDRRVGPLQLLRERPGLRNMAAATLLVTYSQSVLESIFALWALARFGFGPRTVGFLLFGVALPALLVQGGAVRRLAPLLGEVRLATAGVLIYVGGLLLIAVGGTLPWTVAGLVCCGVGLGAFNPAASALASRQAQSHDRGSVMGTYQSSGSLARVLGPFTAGPIYALMGSAAPFLVGACVTLPAVWLIQRARPVARAGPA